MSTTTAASDKPAPSAAANAATRAAHRRRGRYGAPHRRRAGARHYRAVARHVHERARHVDRQRFDPGHRRRPRRLARPGHLGHHLVRRRQRHFAAADRMAHATLRSGAPVHGFGAAVRIGVAVVRDRAVDRAADPVSRHPGSGGGADDSAVAVAAAVELSQEERGTALAMWAITTLVAPVVGPLLGGWITDNYFLAVDFLHQRAGRHWRGRSHVDDLSQARDRHASSFRSTPSASRCWWSGSARCRSCSTRARTWTGSTPPMSSCSRSSAVVGFAFFLVWELTDRHPVVDLRLFARRNFWTGSARDVARLRDSSSATWCCFRYGCSSTWATTRPRPAWCWRRSASWRSC